MGIHMHKIQAHICAHTPTQAHRLTCAHRDISPHMHTCRHKHFQQLLSLHYFLGPADSPKPPLPGACQQWPLFPLTGGPMWVGKPPVWQLCQEAQRKFWAPSLGSFLALCSACLAPVSCQGWSAVGLSVHDPEGGGVCLGELAPLLLCHFPLEPLPVPIPQRAYMRPVGLQQLPRVHVCLERPRVGERMGPVSPWPSERGVGSVTLKSAPLCAAWPQNGQGQGPVGAAVGGAPLCWVSSGLAQDTLTSQGRICSFA